MNDAFLLPVPESPLAITSGFVETVLQSAGRISKSTQIRSIAIADTDSFSLVGNVIRINISYSVPDATGPASIIAKFPSRNLRESPAFSYTEARFYLHKMHRTSVIEVPEVYYCRFDEVTGNCCLLLEDLSACRFVKQIVGCSEEQALLAIREIAKLHGTWWNRVLPADLSWIKPVSSSYPGNFCSYRIRSYRGEWPAILENLMPVLVERLDVLRARLSSAPYTVVHGDFHSQNICFSKHEDKLTLIDFQFVQQATGMLDIARFMATSLHTDLRRSVEQRLLRAYLSCLEAQGISNYDADSCVNDFRAALLWNLFTPVALHLTNVMEHGKEWPKQFPVIERCIEAINDWEALKIF